MSIKVVTFFFFHPVINVFQFPFLIIIKVVTHLFLSCFICFTCSLLSSSRLSRNFLFPFFHNFLTIPFHEYQGCHVFFSLVINIFQLPYFIIIKVITHLFLYFVTFFHLFSFVIIKVIAQFSLSFFSYYFNNSFS